MNPLRDKVIRRIKQNADETKRQKDLDHAQWCESPEGLVELIKFPTLGIPPSKRTVEQQRDLILYQMQISRENPDWEWR